MATKVNFLKNIPTLSERDYQRERVYLSYAIVLAILTFVIMLSVISWQFIVTNRYNKIAERVEVINKQLSGLTEASAQQIYLKSRLKLVEEFLSERSSSRAAIQKIFSLELPGVTISGATFESDNVLSLQTMSNNVLSLETLVNYFSYETDYFLQTVSEGVSRSDLGQYQMRILLTIPGES